MRRFVTILMLCTGCLLTAGAQTFTQRLQEKARAGEGTVTITHDKAIDDLVNRQSAMPATASKPKVEQPAAPVRKSETKPQQPLEQVRDSVVNNVVITNRKNSGPGYRVDGYRVQAFAGGNHREDRQKAENIGATIQSRFPGVEVYVRFYSPRWVCRVGNYRTYEEANEMLKSIRSIGITGASIVKGKITVY